MNNNNKSRKSQGEYTTLPASANLVRENNAPAGVTVLSDNEFYGNPYDQFDYSAHSHSKRALTAHDKKVKSSFVSNWHKGENTLMDKFLDAAAKGAISADVLFYTQSSKPLNIK